MRVAVSASPSATSWICGSSWKFISCCHASRYTRYVPSLRPVVAGGLEGGLAGGLAGGLDNTITGPAGGLDRPLSGGLATAWPPEDGTMLKSDVSGSG